MLTPEARAGRRRGISVAAAAAAGLMAGGAGLHAQEAPPLCDTPSARLVTNIGERRELNTAIAATPFGPPAVGTADEAARYLRVLLTLGKDSRREGWVLVVRDEAYRVLQTLGPDDFARSPTVWTQRLPVSSVRLDLDPGLLPTPVVLRADAYIRMPAAASQENTYYSLKNQNKADYQPIETIPKERRRDGDAVGFLITAFNDAVWTCSGVALTEELFLTNWHCGRVFSTRAGIDRDLPQNFWNKMVCSDTTLDFSWDGDAISQDFTCAEVVATSEVLDYALLRMIPTSSNRHLRPAVIDRTPVLQDEALEIIHHPASLRKQVSTNCKVTKTALASWRGNRPGVRFGHDCDTEAGSSGAPVFDTTGKLRGLHHHGFDRATVAGGAAGVCSFADDTNKAIYIGAILDDLAVSPQAKDRPDVRGLLDTAKPKQ